MKNDPPAKLDSSKIRADFPIFKRLIRGKPLIYLDNPATTQHPQCVIDAISNFYSQHNANIRRATHLLSYEATQLYEEAHKKVAAFIGADNWHEIVFTRNATEALNLIAYAWGYWNLQEGDEILLTIMEHHSNIVPWQMLQNMKGIKLKYAMTTPEGRLDMDDFRRQLTSKVKLVSINHASNVLGTINPVKEMVLLAKNINAVTIIDGAQSVPHIPVNVKEIGCDFMAVSGHKMLGPTGSGFLYGKKKLMEKMHPFLYGGDMIDEVTLHNATWNELPWKYEAGTPAIADAIGLGAAIDYLSALGMENIMHYEQELNRYCLEQLQQIPDITIHGPLSTHDRLGVFTFNLNGISSHEVANLLDTYGIAVRSGNHCAQPLANHLHMGDTLRIGFYIYNTRKEIDVMIEILKKALALF
ncbi:MAG: cysteine desulfurase [Candidatus Fischerbacteria bacterium RBG_13_37_8]|uniref:Cysteine desulfurase n=1 Tax=Candidatus Fischerbacteria bacterium RBG_13_37_8 TaxID=1817863 RepID=A0A1F5V802_9BACT|nr:MAG: cysteine desulfurase [Candidatus Fischerbacteria bacterium RBG_13_37_8]